jgi:hypothetical protein
MFSPQFRVWLGAAIGAALCGLATGEAHASAGCDAVNAGGYNVTNYSPNVIATISNFAVGDQLSFVVSTSGGSGQFLLIASITVLNAPVTTVPGTPSYTITGTNGDTTLQVFFSPSGGGVTITVSATCTPAPSPSPSPSPSPPADQTGAAVNGFLRSRSNGLLLNEPGGTSLLNRQQASSMPGPGVLGFNSTPSVGGMGLGGGTFAHASLAANRFDEADGEAFAGPRTIQFRNSLSDVARTLAKAKAEKERAALGLNGGLQPSYESPSPFDIWVEGRYSAFDDDAAGLSRDGHVGVVYLGADYQVVANVLLGALVEFDWSEDSSGLLQLDVDGNGWMAGPYLSMRLLSNLYFDVRAAWGRSSNDIVLGTISGGFDTTRWLVKGELAGNWTWDAWRITPSAELAYIEEHQDAFTDSAGTFVSGQTVSLGRLTFGPEIGHKFVCPGVLLFEPYAAIKGVWDFDRPDVAIIEGVVVGPGAFWGRLEGGLQLVTLEGWLLRGLASYDGLGADDYEGYTLQGEFNVPLN